MAKRRRKNRAQSRDDLPGWMWMLFGLAIGLAVALAVYVKDRDEPVAVAASPMPAPEPEPQTAGTPDTNMDRNGETMAASDEPASRFDFYDMLPNFEVVIPEQEPDVKRDVAPRAIVDPGEYVLQAGSFSRYEDADRRRAELALQGIESTIQRVAIDDRTYHRVRIGPTRDLDSLNEQRARLRQANIDVLRIRLGD